MSFYQSLSNESLGIFDTLQFKTNPVTNYVMTAVDDTGLCQWSNPTELGVTSIQGTANQVLANGNAGTQETGDVILTLPQDIATTSSPSFTQLLMANGSDSTPSFSFADETNTGIYKYAAGTLALVLGGSIGYYFNTAGLTMPGNAITGVSSLNLAGDTFSIAGQSQPSSIWQYTKSMNQSLATTSSPTFVNITGTLSTASQPNITSLGNLTGLTVSSGTTSLLGSSISSTQWGYVGGMDQAVAQASNARFASVTVTGCGSWGSSAFSLTLGGSAASPVFRLTDSTTGFYRPTTNQLAISCAGSQVFNATSSALVMLGNSVNSTQWGYLAAANQSITTTSAYRAGSLAVGSTTTVGSGFTIDAQAASGECWVGATGYGSGAPSRFIGRRAGGTQASPTATTSGVTLCLLDARGRDDLGNWTGSVGNIGIASTQAFTSTAQGTVMTFQTTPNGSTTAATRLTINQDGTVQVAQNLSSINGTSISTTQWGYLGALNQSLTTTSDVTHNRIILTSDITGTSNYSLRISNSTGFKVQCVNVNETSGTNNIAQFTTGTTGGTNSMRLNLAYTGNATVANRLFTLQTVEEGVAGGGSLAIQTGAGTLSLGTGTLTMAGTTVASSKWAYVSNMDQNVSTTAGPTFASLVVTGTISSINGQSFNSSKWGYLNSINQPLASSDSPLFNTLNCTTLNATTLAGTLSTAAQTNITSVGTLTSLTVTNNVSCGSLTVNGSAVTIPTSGTYTPTLTLNNFTDGSVTAATVRWQRINSVVTMTGSFTMNYVTDFTGDVYMTLPFSQNNFSGTTSAQGFCNVQNWTGSGSFSTYCNVASRTSNQQLTFTPVIWNAGTAPLSTSVRWSFSISYDVV